MKILRYIVLQVEVGKDIEDPTSGRLFIWLISCFLFISVAAGGCFLLVYLLAPPNPSLSWLPFVGVALVCLPWLFWILTCCYRLVSRACGFRMVVGGGGCVPAGNEGGSGRARSFNAAETAGEAAGGNTESPGPAVGGGGGAATTSNQNPKGASKKNIPASNSSNDLSVTSHESEMPLTRNMAS